MTVDGGQVISDLMWLLPNMRTQVNCPHCYTWHGIIGSVIVHLNDAEHWSREQIADWLDTLDVDLTFPTEPPPRPEPAQCPGDYAVVTDSFVNADTVLVMMSSPKMGKSYWVSSEESKPIYLDAEAVSHVAGSLGSMSVAFKEFSLKFNPDPKTLKLLFGSEVKSCGNPCAEIPPSPLSAKRDKVYPQPKLTRKERKDGRRRSRH